MRCHDVSGRPETTVQLPRALGDSDDVAECRARRASTVDVTRAWRASKRCRDGLHKVASCKEWPEAHAAERRPLVGREAVCALATKLGRPRELTRGISVQKKYMGQFPDSAGADGDLSIINHGYSDTSRHLIEKGLVIGFGPSAISGEICLLEYRRTSHTL